MIFHCQNIDIRRISKRSEADKPYSHVDFSTKGDFVTNFLAFRKAEPTSNAKNALYSSDYDTDFKHFYMISPNAQHQPTMQSRRGADDRPPAQNQARDQNRQI